jgi:DNA-binding CsgD family transcriptional regulator
LRQLVLELAYLSDHRLRSRAPCNAKFGKEITTLTSREREALGYLLLGCSESETARRMRVSPNTVHSHTKSLYKRLSVRSRPQLIGGVLRALVEHLATSDLASTRPRLRQSN